MNDFYLTKYAAVTIKGDFGHAVWIWVLTSSWIENKQKI